MKLIVGNKLSEKAKSQVLAAYCFRPTIENGYPKRNPCGASVQAISDAQWLSEHSFWVTASGNLSRSARYCMPAYFAEI